MWNQLASIARPLTNSRIFCESDDRLPGAAEGFAYARLAILVASAKGSGRATFKIFRASSRS